MKEKDQVIADCSLDVTQFQEYYPELLEMIKKEMVKNDIDPEDIFEEEEDEDEE